MDDLSLRRNKNINPTILTNFSEPPMTSQNLWNLTSAQLGIFDLFLTLLLVIMVCGAPVALPFQHMTDHHTEQAQKEENRHQHKGDVVWIGPAVLSSTVTSYRMRNILNTKLKKKKKSGNSIHFCKAAQKNKTLVLTAPFTATWSLQRVWGEHMKGEPSSWWDSNVISCNVNLTYLQLWARI